MRTKVIYLLNVNYKKNIKKTRDINFNINQLKVLEPI